MGYENILVAICDVRVGAGEAALEMEATSFSETWVKNN
jgi:hypothetical protein